MLEAVPSLIFLGKSAPDHQSPRTRARMSPNQPWSRIPFHLLSPSTLPSQMRAFSSSSKRSSPPPYKNPDLTHVTPTGTAQMVSIAHKSPTSRLATAVCSVSFSTPTAIPLIRANQLKKGDVLAVARIAGIMAAKRTPDLIPLCHPIPISHVSVELEAITPEEAAVQSTASNATDAGTIQHSDQEAPEIPRTGSHGGFGHGSIEITATVSCDGKTGVEMEALTAASVAALTVYDMCKAVDKGMKIDGLRVIRKEGGKSGLWVDGVNTEKKDN